MPPASDPPASTSAAGSPPVAPSPLLRHRLAAGTRALASHSQTGQDLFFGTLAALMWGGSALKMAPLCSAAANVQTALGLIAICAISLAWPLLGPASYQRWRVSALAALRLFLICLPVNFDVAGYDALGSAFVSGHLSWIANATLLFTNTHLDMLLFMSLGWRLPLRVHMPVQAASIAVLMRFGLHPHLQSQLLSTPEVARWVSGIHSSMAFLSELFLPAAALLVVPEDRNGQTAALLCFTWVMAGWLLPTLLLRGPRQATAAAPAAAPGGQQQQFEGQQQQHLQHVGTAAGSTAAAQGACQKQLHCLWAVAAAATAKAGHWAEAGLAFLSGTPVPPPLAVQQEQHQLQQQQNLPTAAGPAAFEARASALAVLPRWFPLTVGLWMACCAAAPMLGPAGGSSS